jgi:hypothetical protein
MPGIRYNAEARRDGREAEGGGLLNRYRAKSSIEGSNPSLSASESKLFKINNLTTWETPDSANKSGVLPSLENLSRD